MARVELAPEMFDDFERFLVRLESHEVEHAGERVAELVRGLDVLAHSPLVGRPVAGGRRELVIGRGARGYVALYRFIADADLVFVIAVRSQREAGYITPPRD